jgi:hypothetical protein
MFLKSPDASLFKVYTCVIIINLVLHYVFDMVPHGHTVNPFDLGKDLHYLFLELGISVAIIIYTIFLIDHPSLTIIASFTSLAPDYISGSIARLNLPSIVNKTLVKIQKFHFFVHWFEKNDEKGKRIVPIPSKFELAYQSIYVILCIIAIFLIKY